MKLLDVGWRCSLAVVRSDEGFEDLLSWRQTNNSKKLLKMTTGKPDRDSSDGNVDICIRSF